MGISNIDVNSTDITKVAIDDNGMAIDWGQKNKLHGKD